MKLTISTEITPELCQQFITHIYELERRRVKTLRISINSPGGEFESGMAMAIAIRNSKIRITTEALSQVASSALLIFAAGHRRISSKFGMFMYHEISVGPSEDKVSNLRTAITQWESDNKRMIRLLSEYTPVKSEVWRHLVSVKNDFYFDAEKALEMGFIHGIK